MWYPKVKMAFWMHLCYMILSKSKHHNIFFQLCHYLLILPTPTSNLYECSFASWVFFLPIKFVVCVVTAGWALGSRLLQALGSFSSQLFWIKMRFFAGWHLEVAIGAFFFLSSNLCGLKQMNSLERIEKPKELHMSTFISKKRHIICLSVVILWWKMNNAAFSGLQKNHYSFSKLL